MRVFPYCTSVRDCYEKAIGGICHRQPKQSLADCVAQLAAARCPDPARPFPCRDRCEASYANCSRPRTRGAIAGRGGRDRPPLPTHGPPE
eukprot:4813590-Prymnesium_polylepis.2